jgi:hypothetical protein
LLTYFHRTPTERAIGIVVDVQAHFQKKKKRFIAYLLVLSLAGLYHAAVVYKRFVDNVLIEIGRTFLWGVTVGPDAALFSGLAGHGLSPSLKGHEKCMILLASPQSATAGCR